MSVICYNSRFDIMAKSLETNVAVVTRVDCINHCNSQILNEDESCFINAYYQTMNKLEIL
jgi:hypothetical protein